jgi:hypothetical protein
MPVFFHLALVQPCLSRNDACCRLFGRFSITLIGEACVAPVAALVAVLTAATSYMTAFADFGDVDMRRAPGK